MWLKTALPTSTAMWGYEKLTADRAGEADLLATGRLTGVELLKVCARNENEFLRTLQKKLAQRPQFATPHYNVHNPCKYQNTHCLNNTTTPSYKKIHLHHCVTIQHPCHYTKHHSTTTPTSFFTPNHPHRDTSHHHPQQRSPTQVPICEKKKNELAPLLARLTKVKQALSFDTRMTIVPCW